MKEIYNLQKKWNCMYIWQKKEKKYYITLKIGYLFHAKKKINKIFSHVRLIGYIDVWITTTYLIIDPYMRSSADFFFTVKPTHPDGFKSTDKVVRRLCSNEW